MGKLEKIVPVEPPAPRAPTVLEHLQVSKRNLVALEAEIPGLLLAVAEERAGAKEGLAILREEIAAAKFAIEHSAKARELAERLHDEAVVAFKASVQSLPVAEIIDGLTRDSCCRRCIRGTGCAITGSDPLAGPCQHPVLVGALELHRYVDNPRIQEIYAAACVKLGLKRLHA
jgi:hypothetical protein